METEAQRRQLPKGRQVAASARRNVPEHPKCSASGPAMSSGLPLRPSCGQSSSSSPNISDVFTVVHFFCLSGRRRKKQYRKKARWYPQACAEGSLFWKMRTFGKLHLTFCRTGKGRCAPGSTETLLHFNSLSSTLQNTYGQAATQTNFRLFRPLK